MKPLLLLLAFTAVSTYALPSVLPESSSNALDVRADASLVGYLGIFFLGNTPDVYFYLSTGNNAFSMKALNGGKPVLVPTLGTGGVRDPSIISGGGAEAGKKWYIVGTDLNIGKVSSFPVTDEHVLINRLSRQHGMHLNAKAH